MSPFTEKLKEGDEEVATLVPSSAAANVQEMVRMDPSQVPERYLIIDQNQQDMPKIADLSHLSSQIPIIDLSSLTKENKEELIKLDLACKDWGFFQIINHGVAREVLQGMKDVAAKFFDLPLEEKNKIPLPSNDVQGYGREFAVPGQTLDWSDALLLFVHPANSVNFTLWPKKPSEFKETVQAYSSEVKRVAKELLGSLSLIMGMEKQSLLEIMNKDFTQLFRLSYYPPCCMPDKVVGLSPHSDIGTLTILMQEDHVNGLQIRHQGIWVPVNPIPNSLIVNIGDMIEIWSNGKYKSIEHRVVTNDSKPRISCATFISPFVDVEVQPLDHMVDLQGGFPPMYKKVRYGDYRLQSLKRKLERKTQLKTAKGES
ncbi:protein SRG1-like [Ziziphus jujuba]|uniref:Protein SRG1-like n=1 Tax=Ziziphus jujuba TaxID=326968 RepID=A0ABM4ACP8_ZIZJJ|nr:protein SRG1-like [Ziziphus jujuba]